MLATPPESDTADRLARSTVSWRPRLLLGMLVLLGHALLLAAFKQISPGAATAASDAPAAVSLLRETHVTAAPPRPTVPRPDLPAPALRPLPMPAIQIAGTNPRPARQTEPAAPVTSRLARQTASAPASIPTPSDRDQNDTLAAYAALLWQRIAATRPPGMHLAGEALLRFTLDRNGRISSAEIARSSGNRLLDKLAIRCLHQAAPFPSPPATLPDAALQFSIVFRFN